jgi:hypothetical protein
MISRIICIFFALVFSLNAYSESFTENAEWGTVKSSAYSATIYKSGMMIINVGDELKFKAEFIQRWDFDQKFPTVKLMSAKIEENKENNSIALRFNYFWNGGEVSEKVTFKNNSIQTSFTYAPFQEKNITLFACAFKMLHPKRSNELKLTGMLRHIESDGALEVIKRWARIKDGLRMLSVKGKSGRKVCFIAEKNAWISLWNWPRLGAINNGNYPKWDNPSRKKGEKYEISYFILITNEKEKISSPKNIKFIGKKK